MVELHYFGVLCPVGWVVNLVLFEFCLWFD